MVYPISEETKNQFIDEHKLTGNRAEYINIIATLVNEAYNTGYEEGLKAHCEKRAQQ